MAGILGLHLSHFRSIPYALILAAATIFYDSAKPAFAQEVQTRDKPQERAGMEPNGPKTDRALGSESSPVGGSTARATTHIVETDETKPPVFLFTTPASLDAIWSRLKSPDFVLMSGAEYAKLLARSGLANHKPAEPTALVQSIAAKGSVKDELADLSIDYGIDLNEDGPVWASIGLDGQTLSSVREGDKELPLRNRATMGGRAEPQGPANAGVAQAAGWEVELRGKGSHRIQVRLLTSLKPTAEGERVEIAIPESPSTHVSIDVPGTVAEAVAGARDLAREPIDSGKRTRLSAHLTPRALLELTWRLEADSNIQISPLAALEGNVALEIDSQNLWARCDWELRAERGIFRSLEFLLESGDEVSSVLLDEQPQATEGKRPLEGTKLTIPLPDPLRPGAPRRLSMSIRRPLHKRAQGETASRFVFHGFPATNAVSQAGSLTIKARDQIWISGSPGRGIRQADPPPASNDKGAKTSVLAYHFNEQPFELALRVEPTAPWTTVEAQTEVMVEAGAATVDSWLNYRVARGEVFEVSMTLPKGVELDSVGPDEAVESAQWHPEIEGAGLPNANADTRVLLVRLSAKARSEGQFSIHIVGRQKLPVADRASVSIFAPRNVASSGGWIRVFPKPPNLLVELDSSDARLSGEFSKARIELAPAWPASLFPGRKTRDPERVLWLRFDGAASMLPLTTSVLPRTLHHSTVVRAVISRQRVDVRQETTCQVNHGLLSRLDVSVPDSILGSWELEGVDVAGFQPLGKDPDASTRFRLSLSREVADSVRLRFRYRLPIDPSLAPEPAKRIKIPIIRVLEGGASPPRMEVSADPAISIKPKGGGWTAVGPVDEGPSDSSNSDSAPAPRLALLGASEGASDCELAVSARSLSKLPKVIASRLFIRTIRGNDTTLRETAWFQLESRDGEVSFELPPGSICERVWVGGEPLDAVETLPSEKGSGPRKRVRFPQSAATGKTTVGISYRTPAAKGGSTYRPPKLLGDAVVEQTLWEARLPRGISVLGSPKGWDDENRWRWDSLGFVRSASASEAELISWAGAPAAEALSLTPYSEENKAITRRHVFSRLGQPTDLELQTAPRWILVGGCSGLSLLLGLSLLVVRPSARWVLAGLAVVAFVFIGVLEANLAVAIAQASVLGCFLTAVSWLLEHAVRWSPMLSGRPADSSRLGGSRPSSKPVIVGSEDSTQIRARPGSTVERPSAPERPPRLRERRLLTYNIRTFKLLHNILNKRFGLAILAICLPLLGAAPPEVVRLARSGGESGRSISSRRRVARAFPRAV